MSKYQNKPRLHCFLMLWPTSVILDSNNNASPIHSLRLRTGAAVGTPLASSASGTRRAGPIRSANLSRPSRQSSPGRVVSASCPFPVRVYTAFSASRWRWHHPPASTANSHINGNTGCSYGNTHITDMHRHVCGYYVDVHNIDGCKSGCIAAKEKIEG
jgi:hypothetical protein